MQDVNKIIVIGGSAGSLPILLYLVNNLPRGFTVPVVVVLHRLKNVASELEKIVDFSKNGLQVREPEDKESIKAGHVYFAPANYHLLVETDKTFSLDYSEPVQYSRPSIDVSFESIAAVYGVGATGVLLSGANEAGAAGLKDITENGGIAIVQNPDTSEYPIMPRAAIKKNQSVLIYSQQQILHYLEDLIL